MRAETRLKFKLLEELTLLMPRRFRAADLVFCLVYLNATRRLASVLKAALNALVSLTFKLMLWFVLFFLCSLLSSSDGLSKMAMGRTDSGAGMSACEVD